MGIENTDGYHLADANATPPTSSSYWVVDGLLLGGSYPGDHEPKKHEQKIRALLDAGVRLFVNLMEPDETDLQGRPFVPYADPVRQLCSEASCVRFVSKHEAVGEQLGLHRDQLVRWHPVGRVGFHGH